jgi:hypothetical protein
MNKAQLPAGQLGLLDVRVVANGGTGCLRRHPVESFD